MRSAGFSRLLGRNGRAGSQEQEAKQEKQFRNSYCGLRIGREQLQRWHGHDLVFLNFEVRNLKFAIT